MSHFHAESARSFPTTNLENLRINILCVRKFQFLLASLNFFNFDPTKNRETIFIYRKRDQDGKITIWPGLELQSFRFPADNFPSELIQVDSQLAVRLLHHLYTSSVSHSIYWSRTEIFLLIKLYYTFSKLQNTFIIHSQETSTTDT